MALSIKKNDIVLVIAGNDRGKKGRVLSVERKKNRVIVEGINVVKKHMKPNRQFQKGGIIDIEKPIHISNVMLECQKCSKPTKISVEFLTTGLKVRKCKKCGEQLDK